jgi:DNA-directed RNA polymerase subunit RPC12/RpoP
MGQRLEFRCWNCGRKYSLYKEITNEQELSAPCPFCNKEAVVKLAEHPKKVVVRGTGAEQTVAHEYQFPAVIPTQRPDDQSSG